MNIKLTYLYRDGANYKKFNEVVFLNKNGLAMLTNGDWKICTLRNGIMRLTTYGMNTIVWKRLMKWENLI